MVKAFLNNVKIAGISTVIPSNEYSLKDDPNLYGGDEKKIERVIKSSGFEKRRVADKDVMSSDMCFLAAEDLIEKLNISRESIDGLLFISYTPDYFMPATSYVLHKRLGLSQNCVVMDIPQACSGFVLGLYQASMMINSGCKNVLVLVGDSFSKFQDMFINHTAPIFGDAGSATLLQYDELSTPIYFNINSDGRGYESLMCKNGAFRNPIGKDDFYEDGCFKYEATMDGGRIFEFTMNSIAPNIEELLSFAECQKDDIDYFVLHQANKFILENIARQLGIDVAKIPMETLSEYGNQCGASIPCAISDMLLDEVTTKKVKMLVSGFGVGLSWASAIISLDKIYCSTLKEI